MDRAGEIRRIIEELILENSFVEGALLAEKKGMIVASSAHLENFEVIAASSAITLGAGEQFFKKLIRAKEGSDDNSHETVKELLIESTVGGYVLMMTTSEETFLVVKTKKDAMLGMIFLDARHAANRIKKILERSK